MRKHRFIAGVALAGPDRARLLAAARNQSLTVVLDAPDVVAACDNVDATVGLGQDGVIIGPLYQSGTREALTFVFDDVQRAVVKSAGIRLFEAFWGDYVGIVRSGTGISLVRAPFGSLPCLFQRMGCGVIASSEIDLLRAASGTPFSLDVEAIGQQLALADVRLATTSLRGIEELRGGSRLLVEPSRIRFEDIWSPWTFADERRRIDDLEDATRRLRQECIAAVAARTSTLRHPLLMLSGGLDSSVLAASLAAHDRMFSCLNMATKDHAGDEASYARRVAAHVGRSLQERAMEVTKYDFARIGAVRTPRPVVRGYQQLVFEAAARAATELGCDGIIDGGGGDNVFCSLRSASLAADCLLDPDGKHHFRRVCNELSQLAGASQWRVAWKARRRAWEKARPYRLPEDRRLLSPDMQAPVKNSVVHPWLEPAKFGLPGRGAHIAMLIAAQGYVEDGPHGAKLNCTAPLVTQPLVEHCLAIPSWHWFARGNNRAAARIAFEACLPPDIAWRQGKGNPESFLFSLLEQNREAMTAHLMDGVLASAGVIDTAALARALRDPERLKGTTYGRILQLVDTESWARGIMAG